jgi:hypothetical protein
MEGSDDRRSRTPAPAWAAAILVSALFILLALVALGARGLPGGETRPPPFAFNIDLLAVGKWAAIISAVIVAIILIFLVVPGGPKILLPPRKKSPILKMLLGVALFLALVSYFQPAIERLSELGIDAGEGAPAGELDAGPEQRAGSRWGLVVLGGAVLLVIWGVARATRNPPGTDVEPVVDSGQAVASVIDAVLAEFASSADPWAVVITAYARMEEALEADGLGRRPSEAPHEYLERALGRLQVSRSAVHRLTRLFEFARFSDHDVDQDMAERAKLALNAIRFELQAVPR